MTTVHSVLNCLFKNILPKYWHEFPFFVVGLNVNSIANIGLVEMWHAVSVTVAN